MSISNRKFKTFNGKKFHKKTGKIKQNLSPILKPVNNMHALDDILKKLDQSVTLDDKIKYSHQAGHWLAEKKSLERFEMSLTDKDAEKIWYSTNIIRKEFEKSFLESIAFRRQRAKLIPPKENDLIV